MENRDKSEMKQAYCELRMKLLNDISACNDTVYIICVCVYIYIYY